MIYNSYKCNTYKAFLGTLSDPAKLSILGMLQERPRTVLEIAKRLEFEQSRVSHNLKKLYSLGFVAKKKQGKERIYQLEGTITSLLKLIDRHVAAYYQHYCECRGEAKKLRWKGKQ